MKPTIALLSTILLSVHCYAQAIFTIVDTTVTGNYEEAIENLNIITDAAFYEDTLYKVRKTCSGEWGGSIWFTNKKTGVEYACAATCPVAVNKLNGKYYVTTALAHILSKSKLIEIEDPEAMAIFKMPKPRQKYKDQQIYYLGDNESQSKAGITTLIDSSGILILGSFIHENQLLHLVADYHRTYLCKVEANRLVTMDTICSEKLPIYDSERYRTQQNSLVIPFNRSDEKGYVEIRDSVILIKRYQ